MTDVKGAVVHLDDLAEPRFSQEAQQIRDMMATMAPDCPLDADVLHAKATAETGLDDFGDDDYRERLDVYLAALQEIPGLHPAGVVNFHAQLLQWLKNRLLLTDLLTRHPEIHDIELLPPIVIAGLPRTGTTHLHNLLAAAPTFRTMPYWESNEPFPLPAEAGVEPDPRRARMDVAVQVVDIVMPHFRLMHEMTTDHVHEEIQLLANDFSTMLFETLGHVPRWRDYYMAHDQTSHYEYLKTQLKAMQFLRGGRRWLLKSPQHLEQLPVLNKVFPGVFVIFTHRDPAPVTLSMLAMLTYSARHALLAGAGRPRSRRPGSTGWGGCSALWSATATPSRRSGRSTCASTSSWPTRWRSPRRCTSRRARSSTTMRARRSATTWPDISAAGTARSRRRPRCSASSSVTCASRSPRTSQRFLVRVASRSTCRSSTRRSGRPRSAECRCR